MGRQQVEYAGQVQGSILTCVQRWLSTAVRQISKKTSPARKNCQKKSIRFYALVDQGLRNPLYVQAAYPGKGPVDKEMESIPVEQFRNYTEYERITHILVFLRNYSSAARLVVVELTVENERFLFGYLTNHEEMSNEKVVELYPTRWNSEFWIQEMEFLQLKRLPSTRLHKISFGLAAKLAAYNTMIGEFDFKSRKECF